MRISVLCLAFAGMACAQTNCPTGYNCGVHSHFCSVYAPPSTTGATAISSLPFTITASGNYYLSGNLSSTTDGIFVNANNVDINLNGFTLTYATAPTNNGLSTQVGPYGIVLCAQGAASFYGQASFYQSNGCIAGSTAANNVTIENGTITQSTNDTGYNDPTNCPGSGVGTGCAHDHFGAQSPAIYCAGPGANSCGTVRHVTITVQAPDSYAIQFNGDTGGDTIQCNTINDNVHWYNDRSQGNAVIWVQHQGSPTLGETVEYNTLVGGPQNGIQLFSSYANSTVINNDIATGDTSGLTPAHAYSNDYAIGGLSGGSTVAYNYVHCTSCRGLGAVDSGNGNNGNINNNYVVATEPANNGEYGTNGNTSGASWVGGCEIDGTRGFEERSSNGWNIFKNYLEIDNGACGGAAMKFTDAGCGSGVTCTGTTSFNVHNNTLVVKNTAGSTGNSANQAEICYLFDSISGDTTGYFSTPIGLNGAESCTSDGDLFGDNFNISRGITLQNVTYTKGSNPISASTGLPSGGNFWRSSAGGVGSDGCAGGCPTVSINWTALDSPIVGWSSSAYPIDSNSIQHAFVREWTQTVFVKGALNSEWVGGATVQYTDSQSNTYTCTTSAITGGCSVVVKQTGVANTAGNAPVTTNYNNYALAVSATGCTTNNQSGLAITATNTSTVTLTGCAGTVFHDVYVANAAAGAGTGQNCANALAVTYLNTATNWAPGITYHLCGTITFGTNVSGITVLGSGTSTAPIIVVFETGAILQSPQFGGGSASGPVGTGCNNPGVGGIVIPSGTTYVIVDGNNTGVIQNTANGNGLTNDTSSVGLYDGGDYTIVRNLTIKNIYQWPSGPANDTNGGCSSDLIVNNAANYVKICNNYLYSAQQGFDFSPLGPASYTPAIDACSFNTFTNVPNFDVSYNTLDDHAWMAHTNGSGIALFHNNQFGLMNKQTTGTCSPSPSTPCGWYNWTGSSSFHLDGLFVIGNDPTTYIADIFWNLFEGDTSEFSTTTGVYCTYTTPTNSGGICNEYENVFYVANATAFGGANGANIINAFSSQASPNVNGPHKIYANDILQSWNICNDTSIQGVGFDYQNNILVSKNSNGNVGYFYGGCTSGQNLGSNMNFDHNLYAGSRQNVVGPNGGFSMWGCPPASCSAISFATWQTNCAASTSGVTGCDAHSLFNTAMTYPALSGQTNIGNDALITDGSNFYPTATSPMITAGANLTSQCPTLIGLCTTPPEFFGVNSNCGSGCVTRPTSGAWDIGAYQFATAPPPSPNAPAILFAREIKNEEKR